MSDVNLSISNEVVRPIIQAKVHEAIVAALGGADIIVKTFVEQIINQKVDSKGNPSTYSYEKTTWLEFAVTNEIKKAIQDELRIQISTSSSQIRESLIKHLQTKKGSDKIAQALIDGLNKTFENTWSSKFDITFNKKD